MTRVPIRDALGRQIKCPAPNCGHPVEVIRAQGRVSQHPGRSEPILTASRYYRCDCPRSGNKLYPANTPVEVIDE